MIRTYITGVVLGIAGAIAALHYVPVVDVNREVSIIAVAPNGGNSETFHINVPGDRIMDGAERSAHPLPPDMRWPENEALSGTHVEIFKLRNSSDAVIGVASRLAVRNQQLGDIIEWVLHLPARGTIYVSVAPKDKDGRRNGSLTAGTQEFDGLTGSIAERWIAASGSDDAPAGGTIELVTTYVANSRNDPAGEAE